MSQSNEAVRGSAPAVDTPQLAVEDKRTGRDYDVPIREGSIRAIDLRQMRTDAEDFGLVSYDPGFLNTAACRSAITYIDGDRGILLYRGYPIEQIVAMPPLWKWHTWSSTANCRPNNNWQTFRQR